VHFIGRLSIALPNTVVRKPSLTFWPHVGSSPTKRMSLRLFFVRVVSGSFSIQSNLAFSSCVFGFPCTSPYFYNPHISYFAVLSFNLQIESSTSNRREFQEMGSALGLALTSCTGLSVQGQYRSEAEVGVGSVPRHNLPA
jgi:hypothetical protein